MHRANAKPQPLEYKRWEREILATEEVALEALCFDMAVDQPWPVLRRAVRGIDDMWAEPESSPSEDAAPKANGHRGTHRATEAVIIEIGWAMLNEGYLAPMGILFRPEITAFAVFVLQLAMLQQLNLQEAFATGAQLAGRFGLELTWSEDGDAWAEDTSLGQAREVRGELMRSTALIPQRRSSATWPTAPLA